MLEWLTKSFAEYSIIWLLISSVLGGFIGAFFRLLFDVIFPQWFKDRREILSAKRKYSTPILLAAVELRDRLENIITLINLVEDEGWLSSQNTIHYYYWSTLYVVARFMGWRRILRRTVVYLDFTTTKETTVYENYLTLIQRGFTKPNLLRPPSGGDPNLSEDKWIYTFWLHAIGDSMVVKDEDELRVKSYKDFCQLLTGSDSGEFRTWADSLGSLFLDITKTDQRFKRIIVIHCIINAFINHVDRQHLRTESRPYNWDLLFDEESKTVKNLINAIAPNTFECE
jgi:hypothetical protein